MRRCNRVLNRTICIGSKLYFGTGDQTARGCYYRTSLWLIREKFLEGMKSSVLDELRYGQPFRDMSEADLAWLEGRIVQRSFAAGESIIGIGDPASRLLFIYRGNVRLEVDPDSRIVAELVPGECFPLETLIPGSIVPSRFRAGQNTTCGELSADDLQALIERSEVFREFCSKRADAMRSHEKRRSVASFSARRKP